VETRAKKSEATGRMNNSSIMAANISLVLLEAEVSSKKYKALYYNFEIIT